MLDEASKHVREAIMLGRTDIVKKLLEEVRNSLIKDDSEHGLDLYQDFLNGFHSNIGSFLHEAVKHGKKDVVRALLHEGTDPGQLNESQDTAVDLISSPELKQVFADVLMQAAAHGNLDQIERLLRSGIDVSVTDTNTTKNTPLHWAASFGNAITIQLLLEQFGADPNIKNFQNMTPLHDAVIRNDLEIVKVLIKFGADPTIKNTKDGKTPIDQAKDKEELLRVLKSSSYLHNNETKSIFTNGLKEEDQSIPINHTEIEEEGKECQDEKVIEERTPLSPVPAVITDERFNLLCPQPKHIQQLSDAYSDDLNFFPDGMTISISTGDHSVHDVLDVWDVYRGLFARIKRRVYLSESQPRVHSDSSIIHCTINPNLFSDKFAYKLTICNHRIKIMASDLIGLRYSIMTLVQLFILFYPNQKDDLDSSEFNEEFGITSVAISDSPDWAMRAVLLDLNPYGRVPKIETLLGYIDIWSSVKINQFHAFFRIGLTEASIFSYSKRDYMTIDRYTMERGIDFIPAIDVDSSVSSILDLEKLKPKIRQIYQCFDRPKFIHIGPKLTSILLSVVVGSDSNFLDYLCLPSETITVILCANSIPKACDLQNQLPDNIVIAYYGFQKNEAFTNALSTYIREGLPIAICTGTTAWSNLAGNPEIAMNNALAASRSIRKSSGMGLINAQWSSHPSMTHLTFSWPGFLMTACLAWNSNVPESYMRSVLPDLLDIHLFGQRGFNVDGTPINPSGSAGKALMELGRAEALLDTKRSSSNHTTSKVSVESILLRILMCPDEVKFEELSIEDFGIAVQQVKKAQNYLSKCQPSKEIRVQALKQELHLTAELLILAARIGRSFMSNSGISSSSSNGKLSNGNQDNSQTEGNNVVGVAKLPPTFRTDIANKALVLVEQYRALWLSRYEPQGMQSSLLVLSNLLNKFIPEGAQV